MCHSSCSGCINFLLSPHKINVSPFLAVTLFTVNTLFAQWAPSGTDIFNTNSGSVAIGTSSPVLGNGKLQIVSTTSTQPGIRLETTGASWGAGFWLKNLSTTAGGNIYGIYANELGQLIVGNEFTHQATITILPNGKMGVGTSINSLGSFKFAVEGKIGAREVQVTNVNPWPDFVFKPTYKLPPLNEVEKFIRQYNHLPDVPSALEVKDGIELGKMSATLLQKVEELTLYIIELNKKVEKMYEENQTLKNK
jgi:hypothetical protein